MPASSLSHLRSLPGPDDITRVQLPNGIVVLSRPSFNSPSVALRGYLPAGGLFDPDERLGLASFTAAALMRGTSRRDFQAIYESLESVGASLGISGGTHSVGFSGKALAEDLDRLLLLLSETLREPAFPVEQVERLRAQILTALAMRLQDTGEMASLTFDQIVYQGHPYSRPDEGYPETIQAVEPGHLIDFHRQHYGAWGMVVAIVGAVDPGLVVEKAAETLGDWHNPAQTDPPDLPAVTPLERVVRREVSILGKSQADIILGAAGPARSDPDYQAALIGNDILGQFGMMGRIGEALREKAGLAYYASSSVSGGLGPGPWEISAGVSPKDIDRAIELVIQEIERFTEFAVSAEEIADSQASFIGHLPLSLESNFGVANALLNMERFQLGLDYLRRTPSLVGSITREQVLQAAQHYLKPDRLAIAVARPDGDADG
jgi:zinc protease